MDKLAKTVNSISPKLITFITPQTLQSEQRVINRSMIQILLLFGEEIGIIGSDSLWSSIFSAISVKIDSVESRGYYAITQN